MDFMEIIFYLSGYYGFNPKKKYSTYWIKLVLIFCWIDYIYSIYLTCLSFYELSNNCLFLEFGCYIFGPIARFNGNIVSTIFRTILFLLLNTWYFNGNQWMELPNEQYNLLKSINIQLSSSSIMKWINKSIFISISMTVFYNLFNIFMINSDSIWLTLIGHVITTYYTYIGSYFFIQSYLINTILVHLFRDYIEQFNCQLKMNRINRKLLKSYWTLYIMIQYSKPILKNFYVILVSCLFALNLALFYLIFYHNNILLLDRILAFIFLLSLFFFMVYFSAVAERIDVQARKLSTIIYEHINISEFSSNNYQEKLQNNRKVGFFPNFI